MRKIRKRLISIAADLKWIKYTSNDKAVTKSCELNKLKAVYLLERLDQ